MRFRLAMVPLSHRFLGAAASSPLSVKEVNGNIFLVNDDGHTERLTTSGIDLMPSISPDGTEVVFVRSAQGHTADAICVIHVREPRAGNPCSTAWPDLARNTEIGRILDPQFSPDSSAVYFFTQPGNFGVIVRADIAPPKSYVVAHSVIPIEQGRSFDVIRRGKYAGDLIIHKDSQKLTSGRLFLYWLTDPYGANLAIIADKDEDVELFRAEAGLDTPN